VREVLDDLVVPARLRQHPGEQQREQEGRPVSNSPLNVYIAVDLAGGGSVKVDTHVADVAALDTDQTQFVLGLVDRVRGLIGELDGMGLLAKPGEVPG
jgi:hypothetical protein